MTDLHWAWNLSAWRVAVAAVALVAGAALIRRHVRRSPDRRVARLEWLRAVVMAMLVVTLLQPERVRRVQREGRMSVAVLTDASGSMATRDVAAPDGPPLSRAEWVEAARSNGLWRPLAEAYDLVERAICAPATDADDAGTDLNAALEEAAAALPSLRAVVLVSDGDWNAGVPPSAAATRLRGRGVPVFGIAVGSDRHQPDLAIESVAAPSYGLVEENLSIPVEIRSRLDREVRTELRLERQGMVVARAPIVIAPQSAARARLSYRPEEPGEAAFAVVLPPEPDEAQTDNNRHEFRMSFRREVLRVLVIDTLPRWEFRYLRNALLRDPGAEVHGLLQHPSLGPGGGLGYLPTFPKTRQELSRYDVVFLGDVGLGEGGLTTEQAEQIRGLVEQQGSGLVFLPGRAHRQMSLTNSPLADLLPVVYDASRPGGGRAAAVEARLALTTSGRSHLLTQLAPSPEENEALWRSLPGFFWHAPVARARPGVEVLAVHSFVQNEHGRLPLLAVRTFGNGHVLFLGTDSAWRWRRGVEDTYHYRFWGQVARWMAHRRHLARAEGLRCFFAPERPSVGDRVRVQATALDATGAPLESGVVEASIAAPSGAALSLSLTPVPGGWGLFEGAFTPDESGPHRVAVRSATTGREVSTTIEVGRRRRERVGEPARPDVLRELAAITGGEAGTAAEAAAVIERVRLLPAPDPIEQRFRLWCHPAWGAVLAVLLTAYWCARKLAGRL